MKWSFSKSAWLYNCLYNEIVVWGQNHYFYYFVVFCQKCHLSLGYIKKRCTHIHTRTHLSDFHLLLRYGARQVKDTPENISPEPPQVHTITFPSVTLPSHSVTFLNNYLSLHRHIESSDVDHLCSGAHVICRLVVICEFKGPNTQDALVSINILYNKVH